MPSRLRESIHPSILGLLGLLGDDVGGGTRYLALATTRAGTRAVDLAGFCELFAKGRRVSRVARGDEGGREAVRHLATLRTELLLEVGDNSDIGLKTWRRLARFRR